MTGNWSIQSLWNDTLLEKEREVKPRDYIRASEVGTSFRDRYYKMMGESVTNSFNARTLRVFESGRLYEWLVRLVLVRCGILQSEQQEIRIEGTQDRLPVIGHLDFVCGGKPNWGEAERIIPILSELNFPTTLMTIADTIITSLMERYPNGLPPLVYDVKSVNSMVFWKHNKNESLVKAYTHHQLQLYTYMKALGLKEGRLLYISKDDLTLAEVQVLEDPTLDKEWIRDIMKMSYYYHNKELPKPPEYIIWTGKKYEVNWQLSRSNYFTRITGIGENMREEFIETLTKIANRGNYRVKKALEKKNDLTESQLIQITQGYVAGQLTQLATGKLQIEKEGTYDVSEEKNELE